MLSILIPEHNYPCSRLVRTLAAQCLSLGMVFEILVMDDASDDYDQSLNQMIKEYPNTRLFQLKTNIGPSKVRNRLAEEALFPNLLFIDCDTEVPDDRYIRRYVEVIGQADVVLGGVAYHPTPPSSDRYLRWYYGRNRECLLPDKRSKQTPRVSFNFMIRKEVLIQHPFNEEIMDYGHEDTVLGDALVKAGFTFLNIDNPLIHEGLDTNLVFLEKSRKAVSKMVLNPVFQQDETAGKIKIFRVFHRVSRAHLSGILSFKYRFAGKWMEKNLCSKHPSLFLYDFYRLCYLCFLDKHPTV
jgi:glycosyltransferase involved in cell wall biosynthesis